MEKCDPIGDLRRLVEREKNRKHMYKTPEQIYADMKIEYYNKTGKNLTDELRKFGLLD